MNRTDQGVFPTGIPQQKNIRDLLIRYLQYWYLFVIGMVMCLLAAVFHVRYNITPQYYVSSTILIKEDNNNAALLGGLTGGMPRADKAIGSEMLVLRSKNLMQRVFSELGYNTSYYIEGRFRDVEVFKDDLPISLVVSQIDPLAYGKAIKISYLDNNNFKLIEYGNDGEEIASTYKFGQEIDKPFANFTVIGSADPQFSKDIIVVFHDIKKRADYFNQLLSITLESQDANVIRLGLTDPVPQRSVLILDKLVEVYNQEAIEDKNQVDLSTIEFLDERIRFLSTELSDVEREVEQYKQENNLTDVVSNAEIYLQTASEYNKKVESFELQLEIINSLEAYVNQEELKLVPSSLNIADPTLNGLIAKYNELQLERQRMLRTIQPSSSLILNLNDQLNNLKQNISENLKNIQNSLMITRNNLQSTSSQFQSKIRQVPSIERELLEINRQQSIKESIYLFLLQSREEAGLALASAVPNSRIIDPAEANGPYNANTSMIYLAALSLGLLIPFAFIYVKDLLNDKVTERKDVEKASNIPILGEIYHSENKEILQITEGNHSVIAETFRLVRANLHFAHVGKQNKVILITSSRSGEGKTFCSINLGASIALSGKKVVILDFDLRSPKLMRDLKLQSQLGISDFLVSDAVSVDSITNIVDKVAGLYAIGAGTQPPNPAELMTSPKIELIIEELKMKYDYIVLDSPPIGQVADAFNLAFYADCSLYVIRYNYTFKDQLALIEDIYYNKKLRNPMVVMNDAKKRNIVQYGYCLGEDRVNYKSKAGIIKSNILADKEKTLENGAIKMSFSKSLNKL